MSWIPPYQFVQNRATARNYLDGTTVVDTSVKLEVARGRVVDLRNSATTFARCRDCRSMAVAVLAVVVPSDAHRVRTIHNVNRAVARRCTNCALLNVLHTIVIETPGQPDLDSAERARLDSLAGQIRSVDRGQPTEQLISNVESLISQYEQALVSSV